MSYKKLAEDVVAAHARVTDQLFILQRRIEILATALEEITKLDVFNRDYFMSNPPQNGGVYRCQQLAKEAIEKASEITGATWKPL